MFVVGINEQGFRGRNFGPKSPGVVRVVTLGASSTFGFYNRDHETYPHQLEQVLNERCDSQHFEVLNLGIPHSIASILIVSTRIRPLTSMVPTTG